VTALWIALAAAAAVVGVGWVRRRRRLAREACRRRLAELLARRRPEIALLAAGGRTVRLEGAGDAVAAVDLGRLGGALRQRDAAAGERLMLALADAAAVGPRPLAGVFELKEHGARTLPRLAGEGQPLLLREPPPVLFTLAELGLAVLYLVDGERFVSAEHLRQAGIDERDLHGVALAVLRQRSDEAEPRRALRGGEAVRLESADGCGGSRILLLPEALEPGERLWATAPSPAVLLVAAERPALERTMAAAAELAEPLPPAIYRATAEGLRREV
jgi:hypothetical protein